MSRARRARCALVRGLVRWMNELSGRPPRPSPVARHPRASHASDGDAAADRWDGWGAGSFTRPSALVFPTSPAAPLGATPQDLPLLHARDRGRITLPTDDELRADGAALERRELAVLAFRLEGVAGALVLQLQQGDAARGAAAVLVLEQDRRLRLEPLRVARRMRERAVEERCATGVHAELHDVGRGGCDGSRRNDGAAHREAAAADRERADAERGRAGTRHARAGLTHLRAVARIGVGAGAAVGKDGAGDARSTLARAGAAARVAGVARGAFGGRRGVLTDAGLTRLGAVAGVAVVAPGAVGLTSARTGGVETGGAVERIV